MFFVSEEFLRAYESGEEFHSTLDEVTDPNESLFPEAHEEDAERLSKGERARLARTGSEARSDSAP